MAAMATEQVTITISTTNGLGVKVAAEERSSMLPEQVDLFAARLAATAVETTETPSEVVETSPEAAKVAPWDNLSGVMPKGLNLPMHPALYVKMVWLTENLPKMSLQRLAKQGTEELVDRLIAEHYKP